MTGYQIADGHYNAVDLEELYRLDSTIFQDFRGGILTTWHDSETSVFVGNRTKVLLGLPQSDWTFFKLTEEEWKYINDNFGNDVTIRTLDKTANTFKTFNATMILPDVSEMQYDIGDWYDVKIRFIDLVEIE